MQEIRKWTTVDFYYEENEEGIAAAAKYRKYMESIGYEFQVTDTQPRPAKNWPQPKDAPKSFILVDEYLSPVKQQFKN